MQHQVFLVQCRQEEGTIFRLGVGFSEVTVRPFSFRDCPEAAGPSS